MWLLRVMFWLSPGSASPELLEFDFMGTVLFGREAEMVAVEAVLSAARHGLSVLVLEGDPGIGKTSVWRTAIAHASGMGYRVLSCRAAPTEARLSFTALGDLLAPVELAAFDALPPPQRRALDAALGSTGERRVTQSQRLMCFSSGFESRAAHQGMRDRIDLEDASTPPIGTNGTSGARNARARLPSALCKRIADADAVELLEVAIVRPERRHAVLEQQRYQVRVMNEVAAHHDSARCALVEVPESIGLSERANVRAPQQRFDVSVRFGLRERLSKHGWMGGDAQISQHDRPRDEDQLGAIHALAKELERAWVKRARRVRGVE